MIKLKKVLGIVFIVIVVAVSILSVMKIIPSLSFWITIAVAGIFAKFILPKIK